MPSDNSPNPKLRAEEIKRFRNLFKSKTCMFPDCSTGKQIISAHTLSIGAVLRKIAVNSEVYAINHNSKFTPEHPPISLEKLGIRGVSVFNGFCEQHDVQLFSCLENEDFLCQRKQNFMLAYRTVARECYLKIKQYESLPTVEKYCTINNIPKEPYLGKMFKIQADICLSGVKDIISFKNKLDNYLAQQAWDRLITHAIIFSKTPNLVATGVFAPLFDMNGTILQNGERLENEVSLVVLSVIPLDKDSGVALFSWLDTANNAPKKFFSSVANAQGSCTTAIIHAVLDNIENFAISPKWYEQLSSKQRDYLYSRIVHEVSAYGVSASAFNQEDFTLSPYLDDWGNTTVTTF